MAATVKDVCIEDLAIIEILNTGRTDAPRRVLDHHHDEGNVEIVNRDGKNIRVLTARGKARAEALRDHEQVLRQRAHNGRTGCSIRGVASCGFTMAPQSRPLS